MAEAEEDHDKETQGTSSEVEESDSKSSSSSSESDIEIATQVVPLAKETKRGASMTETKTGNPSSSQTPSLPEFDNKNTEEEQKGQRCKDTWLLDKNSSEWHDQMISEGRTEWKKYDTMTCDYGDPCKELKYPDLAGPPLDYMKHCGVFKVKKTNKYNLCHFYGVELSGDLPKFPSLYEPATCEMLKDFLLKAPGSRASKPSGGLCMGLGHGHLSATRATQQRQPQAPAN